ncbi:MAG: hypothetical protein IIT58_00365 [Treponema sp.]|nr:hypothetical protein [Treponema sp.]
MYTSECCPNPNYNDTYGVDIKNFIYTNSKIEFDLLDGEYSESEYAHYVISI